MESKKYLLKHLPKDKLEDGMRRLENNEPVQYIVGNVDFYGYNLKVNKSVLIPRFETEQLVEKTISYIKKMNFINPKVLDIGTGSGAIAITLFNELNSVVVASDISSDALLVAKENSKLNNAKIKFVLSDIFENIDDKFDVLISNPPYISKSGEIEDVVLKNEPHLALFADNDGLYFYEKILSEARKYVKERFIIAFEIGFDQGDSVLKISKQYFKDSKILIEEDLSNKIRFLFIIKE